MGFTRVPGGFLIVGVLRQLRLAEGVLGDAGTAPNGRQTRAESHSEGDRGWSIGPGGLRKVGPEVSFQLRPPGKGPVSGPGLKAGQDGPQDLSGSCFEEEGG